ncbi:hypothetical protein phD2B_0013 [Lelliottia phage phD2B]|uniref:Uncharacterized protein n=1 Tax=Lelliottia phage phD2B TaxID=1542498 RepID=A0A088FT54_9CAUD|nr:hypothetical protein phD2B_0013 [Lelliottia phage phD2B]AIM51240.1 hypothetical protein phD2B_0013 [Lelliottia phage phD2B]
MKRNQVKQSHLFRTLRECGVGERKALRMIKHAMFVNKKAGDNNYDCSPAGFCIWVDQGKYARTWQGVGHAR